MGSRQGLIREKGVSFGAPVADACNVHTSYWPVGGTWTLGPARGRP